MSNSTIYRQTLIALLACVLCGARVSAQEKPPVSEDAAPVESRSVTDEPVAAPPLPAAEAKIPDIIGTWSRAESGTFSKLTIWPVENREFLFFVEGADGNGLLEWKPANSNFQGFFTFNVLGDRTAQVSLQVGPKETRRLIISPFEDQRKQLLRTDFAKTERELDQKLSSDWTRVEASVQPMTTVAVVKTEFGPARIFQLLRAKYRESPYRFFSNNTFRSVIVVAPAEAQEDIEVLIHKLDVKEESNVQAASPNIAQQSPANQPQASSRRPDEVMPDITGTWSVKFVSPEIKAPQIGEMEIRRMQHGETDFLIDQPWITVPTRISVKWSAARQRFEGEVGEVEEGQSKITLQPLADRHSMRVIISDKLPSKTKRSKAADTNLGQAEEYVTQEWTRTSLSFSATFPAKVFGLPETAVPSEDATDARDPSAPPPPAQRIRVYEPKFVTPTAFEAALQKLFQGRVQRITIDQRTNAVIIFAEPAVLAEVDSLYQVLDVAPRKPHLEGARFDALLGTSAAKQMVEQLHAQESAAAAEAATIRQLQASGQAEQNRQPIAEHQRKLKNLLSTAFDLKLQLEELQVQELQSRLSRLERQIGQRKELREKIIARRAKELIEGDGLKWDSAAPATTKLPGQTVGENKQPAAAAAVAEATTTKPDPLPSPEDLHAQLEPLAKRVTAAAESVRKLEVTYLRERSNSAELKRALDELTQARGEWRNRLKALELTFLPIGINQRNAEIFSDSLRNRVDTVTMQFADGKATEAELIAATESWKRATESLAAAKATMGRYDAVLTTFADMPGHEDVNFAISGPVQAARSQPGYHPDVALAWLEAATSLKLEFVRFDDLHFWFKAALRVRESGAYYKSGDLIVTLNGQLFESLDQAVDALRPRLQAETSDLNDVVLTGGLAGLRQRDHFSPQNWCRYLEPSSAVSASIKLEVRVRRDGTEEPETCYISGLCISPEGLVVIPVASRSLVPGEAVVAFGSIKGTARVVASDDEHGLTLIKLSSPNQPLFQWIKCREGQPSLRQRLQLHDGGDSENFTTHSTSVFDVSQPLPKPFLGNDAFVVNTHKNVIAAIGAPLMTVENELQGIVMASTAYAADAGPERQDQKRHIAIPAVHLAKLLDGHRKATARDHVERPDVKLSFADEKSPATAAPKSLDEWLAVLRASRNGAEVVMAAREIARLATTADAERAASTLLAAAEYFGATSQTDANEHALTLAMGKLDQSGKIPAIANALRDGPPGVRYFAFGCVGPLNDCAVAKDFPALAEQLLKIAAGEDLRLRVSSLGLLAETLPITELNAADFSTEERREMARRLTEHVPRDRVISLLEAALGDKQIDLTLVVAKHLAKLSDEAMGKGVSAKLMDVLAKLLKGKLDDVTATRFQRGQALTILISLNARAAPAVPALIELLKSDDPDLKPIERKPGFLEQFTRDRIITALERIGPAAKDALPDLEAALVVIVKKEKEDALLSPNTKARGQSPAGSTAARLSQAIRLIKGQDDSK